jgi:hypothetical protein
VRRIAANSFWSKSSRQTSSVISSKAPVREVPALLTTMSILPNRDLVIGATEIGGDRHIGLRRGNARASTLRDDFDRSIERLLAPRDNGNLGAAGCEPRRDSEPDALASAGDHGRPAGEIDVHGVPPNRR